ncbi:MAG: ribonuclease P protein component [Coriobacteriia bacterium]|nr:ribonuclease P protein component [Coriobacteriia bacterium]
MLTIKSSQQIDLIFKNGKSINLPFLNIVYYDDKQNKLNGNVAFIAGKKYGNAVWRNKSKRIMRGLYNNIKTKYKILLIAKPGIIEYDKKKMKEEFTECIKKL